MEGNFIAGVEVLDQDGRGRPNERHQDDKAETQSIISRRHVSVVQSIAPPVLQSAIDRKRCLLIGIYVCKFSLTNTRSMDRKEATASSENDEWTVFCRTERQVEIDAHHTQTLTDRWQNAACIFYLFSATLHAVLYAILSSVALERSRLLWY